MSSNSKLYVDQLNAQVARYGPWVNTSQWSTPVYIVRASQRRVPVTLNKPAGWDSDLRAALTAVPIPADAEPSPDSDGHMVIWQPRTNTMWEFWQANRSGGTWQAPYGGRIEDASQNPGVFTNGWGATATGLPLLGGLIRIRELRSGVIPHAVSFGLPEPRASVHAWPAQSTDGTNNDPSAIPEGTRFRIDPSVDLSKLPMSPFVRMLATAVQRYGMIATDTAGAVTFYAEQQQAGQRNPYGGFFEGRYPDQLLAQFPWSHLEVVDAPTTCDGNCAPPSTCIGLPGLPC